MPFDKRKALQSALAFTQQGRWDKAIAEYQAILRVDPRNRTVCNNLGDLYARVGKPAEAIDQYLKLGDLYRTDGLSVKAIAVYKKITKLDPHRTEAYLACADLYQEQGLVGEAKVQLATVVEHYGRAGDTARATQIYRRLTELDPTNYLVLTKLADLLAKQGMREAAAAEYERAAQVAQTAGQTAEGRRLFQRAWAMLPESAGPKLDLVEFQLREGRYAEAASALAKVTAADPGNVRAWRLLGETYERSGDTDAAIHAYHQLLETDPSDSDARARIEVLEAAPAPPEELDLRVAFQPEAGSTQEGEPSGVEILPTQEEGPAPVLDVAENVETAPEPLVPEHVLPGLEPEPQMISQPPIEPQSIMPPIPALCEGTAEEPAFTPTPQAAPPEEEADISEVPGGQRFEIDGTAGSGDLYLAAGDPASPIPREANGLLRSGGEATLESLPKGAEEESPSVDFLGEGIAGLGVLEAGDETSGKVAEQLAEAEVYLKYGLADKARDRFLDAVRLAPNHMVAHQRLKAIYLERNQIPEVCKEILAIAEILSDRFRQEAALREIREGLKLAPDDPGLLTYLARLRGEGPTLPDEPPPVWDMAPPLMEETVTPDAAPTLDARLEFAAERESPPAPSAESLAEGPAKAGGQAPSGAGAAQDSVGDEELPPELRALLLEDAEEESAIVLEEVASGHDQVMAEDLAEASFYLEQGMREEARTVHLRMRARDPGHPAVVSLANRLLAPPAEPVETRATPEAPPAEESGPSIPPLAGLTAGHSTELSAGPSTPPETAPPLPVAEISPPEQATCASDAEALGIPLESDEESKTVQPHELPVAMAEEPAAPIASQTTDSTPGASLEEISAETTVPESRGEVPAGGFIDLGTEPTQEVAAEERGAPAEEPGPLVDGLLQDSQKGLREQSDERDSETHYNLGIAYKEMELYEEAVAEFRLACRDPGRALPCAHLLGVCLLAVGQTAQAIAELKAGLEVPGHPKDAYHLLRYDLGTAYEAQGDLVGALEQLEIIHAEDPRFQDVRMKVQSLRQRVPRRPAPPLPAAPGESQSIPGRPRKKKISFI